MLMIIPGLKMTTARTIGDPDSDSSLPPWQTSRRTLIHRAANLESVPSAAAGTSGEDNPATPTAGWLDIDADADVVVVVDFSYIPTVEIIRDMSFLFPPKPLLVKLLTA